MALLTGHNHHSAGAGQVMEISSGYPGSTGRRPNNVAPVAEILRLNGYNTAAFGKSHETPAWERSASGPFDRWPTRSGFDKFYEFMGGDTDQWSPVLYDGMTRIKPPKVPNYHLTTDLTNHAIAWMRLQKAMTPERPFFLYFAPGAGHAPHTRPRSGLRSTTVDSTRDGTRCGKRPCAADPTRGCAARYEAHTQAGRYPRLGEADCGRDALFTRQMEVFAGFVGHADHEMAAVDALEEQGQLENTLLLYIVGDNGAGAEGAEGTSNEATAHNGLLGRRRRWRTNSGESTSWAGRWRSARTPWAGPSPATRPFSGPRRLPRISAASAIRRSIHRPNGIHARGEIRSQFHHVIDVAPTVLEAAGLPQPKSVNGTLQKPIEGVSMVYTFDNAQAKSRHTTQYFEMFGNRGVYHDGVLMATFTAPHAVEDLLDQDGALRPGQVGAVSRYRRLQPGQRPVRQSIRKS